MYMFRFSEVSSEIQRKQALKPFISCVPKKFLLFFLCDLCTFALNL